MSRKVLLPSSLRGTPSPPPRKVLLPPNLRGMGMQPNQPLDFGRGSRPAPKMSELPRQTIRMQQRPSEARAVERDVLSDHDKQVLRWLSLGKRAGEIADIMQCKANAIHQSVHRVLDKMGASSPAGAVGKALRQGLIE